MPLFQLWSSFPQKREVAIGDKTPLARAAEQLRRKAAHSFGGQAVADIKAGVSAHLINSSFHLSRVGGNKTCFLVCSPSHFHSLLSPPLGSALRPQVTLQYLWEKEYQVLVFYHHPMALEVPFLWPGQMMPSPWANTTDPEKLIQFLQASVTDRRSGLALLSLVSAFNHDQSEPSPG